MTRKYSRGFSEKHPQGTTAAAEVSLAVRDRMIDQRITCVAAHTIAAELKITPREVGIAIDLQEGRIRECQLGLFGHGPQKTIKPAEKVPPHLQTAIEAALVDGRLPCIKAWRIADAAELSRAAVGEVCEHLGIKISKCQLGAF